MTITLHVHTQKDLFTTAGGSTISFAKAHQLLCDTLNRTTRYTGGDAIIRNEQGEIVIPEVGVRVLEQHFGVNYRYV